MTKNINSKLKSDIEQPFYLILVIGISILFGSILRSGGACGQPCTRWMRRHGGNFIIALQ
jgi:hypothetical protein